MREQEELTVYFVQLTNIYDGQKQILEKEECIINLNTGEIIERQQLPMPNHEKFWETIESLSPGKFAVFPNGVFDIRDLPLINRTSAIPEFKLNKASRPLILLVTKQFFPVPATKNALDPFLWSTIYGFRIPPLMHRSQDYSCHSTPPEGNDFTSIQEWNRKHIRRKARPPIQAGPTEIIALLATIVPVAGATASIVKTWLRERRSIVKIKIINPDGKTIEFESEGPLDLEQQASKFLDRLDEAQRIEIWGKPDDNKLEPEEPREEFMPEEKPKWWQLWKRLKAWSKRRAQ